MKFTILNIWKIHKLQYQYSSKKVQNMSHEICIQSQEIEISKAALDLIMSCKLLV